MSFVAGTCIQSDSLGKCDFQSELELQYGLNVIKCGLGCHLGPKRSRNESDRIRSVLKRARRVIFA